MDLFTGEVFSQEKLHSNIYKKDGMEINPLLLQASPWNKSFIVFKIKVELNSRLRGLWLSCGFQCSSFFEKKNNIQ